MLNILMVENDINIILLNFEISWKIFVYYWNELLFMLIATNMVYGRLMWSNLYLLLKAET